MDSDERRKAFGERGSGVYTRRGSPVMNSFSSRNAPSSAALPTVRIVHPMVEAAGVEPASEAAYRTTSTSVVPVLFSPIRRPGTRL